MEENYNLPKWLNDEMDVKELEQFQKETEFDIYDKIKHYSSQLETSNFDEQSLLNTIVNTPKKERKAVVLKINWFTKIAAILVLMLGLYFSFNFFSSSTDFANNGTHKIFNLPDNSEITLNSGSQIEYKKWNWNSNRTVHLEGEAYFEVAKGKKFEVKTSSGTVSVLGTHFNVKQRKNRFEVSCYEGKVKVTCKNQKVIITKGMSVAFDDGKPVAIPENDLQKPEWLTNEMVFYKEELSTVINEFERRFNIKITLNSEDDNHQLFSGTIPSENITVALKFLSTTYHLNVIKSSADTFILTPIDAKK